MTALLANFLFQHLQGAPQSQSRFIRIDQFGYCTSIKIAVIVDLEIRFDADDCFNPSIGESQYRVPRWSDDAVVFTGTLQVRNGGTILAKNGDLGWYFDFSDFIDPGRYYIYDLTNEVGSYGYDIESTAYNPLMYHASRFYYYLR